MARLSRRHWLFLALVPFVLLASFYVWLLILPGSGRITKANFDSIQIGMTIEEVNDLLGEDAAQPMIQSWPDGHTDQVAAIYTKVVLGIMPGVQIDVDFAENRVTRKEFRAADWSLASFQHPRLSTCCRRSFVVPGRGNQHGPRNGGLAPVLRCLSPFLRTRSQVLSGVLAQRASDRLAEKRARQLWVQSSQSLISASPFVNLLPQKLCGARAWKR